MSVLLAVLSKRANMVAKKDKAEFGAIQWHVFVALDGQHTHMEGIAFEPDWGRQWIQQHY